MKKQVQDEPENDLPEILSNPARQALIHAGYLTLKQVATMTEKELLALHGVGPKTIVILRPIFAERGLSFAEPKPNKKSQKD
jgi:hypothetical protein